MTTTVKVRLKKTGNILNWEVEGDTDQKKTIQVILRLKPGTRWNQVFNRMQKKGNYLSGSGEITIRAGCWYEATSKGWDNGVEKAFVSGYMQPGENSIGAGDTTDS